MVDDRALQRLVAHEHSDRSADLQILRTCQRVRHHFQPVGRSQIVIPVIKLVRVHVAAMTAEVGAYLIEKLARAIKWRRRIEYAVDEAAASNDGEAFLEGHDRCRLVGRDVGVTDQSHDQAVAQRAGMTKEFDMPVVEKIADHVGIYPYQWRFRIAVHDCRLSFAHADFAR